MRSSTYALDSKFSLKDDDGTEDETTASATSRAWKKAFVDEMKHANACLCRQATILRTMTNSYNVNHFWQAFENRTVIRRRQLMQLSTDCLGADFETGSVNSGSYQYPLTEN